MKRTLYAAIAAALLTLSACSSLQESATEAAASVAAATAAQDDADTVFVNGKILTVDDDFSIVSALAVKGERIAAVGDRESVAGLIGDATKVVDLSLIHISEPTRPY